MFGLGLLVSVAYWPGWISPALSPRFAVLSIIATGLLLWRPDPIPFTRAHLAGLAFVILAALSVLWSAVPPDSIDALWQVVTLPAICFCLGSQRLTSLRPLVSGAAIGLGVSSAFAVAQWLGWAGLPEISSPSGLFLNGNYMAEGAALVLVAAVAERLWWAVPVVLPALTLPGARGAILGVAAGLGAYLWRRFPASAIMVGLGGALAVIVLAKPGMAERLDIWAVAVANLDWLGHGIGSFWATPVHAYADGVPTHAHNEFIELASDLGPLGVALFAGFAWELRGAIDTARIVLIALAVEAVFAFPTHMPLTLALGAVCAGFAVRDRPVLRIFPLGGRGSFQESLS